MEMLMERRHRARDTTSDFVNDKYYRFANALNSSNTISAGVLKSSDGAINMTIIENFSSSENWQLYLQNGRYFIRNYDYGSGFQLGLQESSKDVPRLYPRSGALAQQWTIAKSGDGAGWTLSNGLREDGSLLALNATVGPPSMQVGDEGSVWGIEINDSAGSPKGADFYADVDGFITPTASSTPVSSTPASVTATSSPSSSASSLPASSSSASPSPASSSSLSTGAIAGIAVGAALLAICGFLVFFFLRRRKRKTAKDSAYAHPPLNSAYTQPAMGTAYTDHTGAPGAREKVTYGYHEADAVESPRHELSVGESEAKQMHRAELT